LYNMADHFKDKHKGVSLPPPLALAVTLGYHEKASVKQLLTKYKAKAVCKGSSCACKKNG